MLAKPMTINERMMYSTVRIEGYLGTEGEIGGTGFFLSHTTASGVGVRMLVSHGGLIKRLSKATLHLHRPRAVTGIGKVVSTSSVPVDVDNFGPQLVPHPDPEVDLCALPYAVVHAAIGPTGQDVYATLFESNQVIPADEGLASVDAAEEVQLIGYPKGLWDSVNSFPVYRRGTIATHPRVDYQGRPEVLIDIVSPSGCSGAPVVILARTAFKEHEALTWPVVLLGVMSPRVRAGAEGVLPGDGFLGTVVKARELLVLAETVAAKTGSPG